MSQRPVTEVAVGIVFSRDAQGTSLAGRRLLFGQRPQGKPYAGWWEFPGGKLEAGETVEQALARELHEELGITAKRIARWAIVEHDYPHAYVRLHFCRVFDYDGEPASRENQLLAWHGLADIASVTPILPAAIPVLGWLKLPTLLLLTRFDELGLDEGLRRIEQSLNHTSESVAIVLREPKLSPELLESAFYRLRDFCRHRNVPLIVSSRHPRSMAVAADGVHLTADDLRRLHLGELPAPSSGLIGVSAHNANELELAHAVGASYACLSPVLETASHPGATGLGWEWFSRLANRSRLPVFALGGMNRGDLETAIQSGAQGLGLRGAWSAARPT